MPKIEEIVEMVEMAEEAAMDELEAFGFIAFEDGVTASEWAELDDDDSADYAFDWAHWDFGDEYGRIDMYELY